MNFIRFIAEQKSDSAKHVFFSGLCVSYKFRLFTCKNWYKMALFADTNNVFSWCLPIKNGKPAWWFGEWLYKLIIIKHVQIVILNRFISRKMKIFINYYGEAKANWSENICSNCKLYFLFTTFALEIEFLFWLFYLWLWKDW